MKYEYQLLYVGEIMNDFKCGLVEGLQKLGQQGWELCIKDGGEYIFKRQLQEDETQISQEVLQTAQKFFPA